MNSIRSRLTRDVLALSAALLGGSLAALYFAARAELQEQFDAALQAKALAVRASIEAGAGRIRPVLAAELLPGPADEPPEDFYEAWDAEGTILARSPSLGVADLPARAGGVPQRGFWDFRLPDGRPGRAFGVVFRPGWEEGGRETGRAPPEIQLVVASSRAEFDEELAALLGIAGTCGALLLGATLWAVPRVLRRGLAPLDRLGEQAARIDADHLSARFPAAGLPQELEPICGRLNALLARLEGSLVRERQFSADLAHELRTPLAELRSLAECALKWPESRDAATDRETLAIARQMEALATSMLSLARGEQGRLAARREPVAVDALVREVWSRYAPRAEARGLRAALVLSPATAAGDPALLRSIFANLFDNAVDHAPPGGALELTVEAGVTVRVANAAGNLTPADVERLFDRFWRKESARSDGQHFGLGLPLARMFATAMGWTLTAALDGERRLVFTLAGPSGE
jgi:signal transduction histidine kinase